MSLTEKKKDKELKWKDEIVKVAVLLYDNKKESLFLFFFLRARLSDQLKDG